MNPEVSLFKQKKQVLLKSNTILLIALGSTFFPRLLQSLKVPSLVNFLHFAIVPLACGIALFNTRSKDRYQIAITQAILFGLLIFFTIIISSALLNQTGVVNIILSFLLWTEPFMFILALTSLPLSEASLKNFRTGVISFNLFHLLVAFIQALALGLGGDFMQGVFFYSGSGHVVASSVSLSFGLYYFTSVKTQRRWLAYLIFAASIVHLVMADAKQVLFTFGFAVAILTISKTQEPVKILIYTISFILSCITFWWGVQNVEALSAFLAWNRPELYGTDGDATQFKLSGINFVISKFHSSWNWWLGLGPGSSLDRLGQMFGEYKQLLLPLGATISPFPDEIWTITKEHWLGPVKGSSFFAPTCGWAAIWADFGFLGLFSYLYLGLIVWRKICIDDDISKILILSASAHGFIFTQMQEPGYMLSVAAFIALRWQEEQVQ
ncbi:hypothetical protein [Calothrix sp. PCC 7507]|uniref:hypothetical protein n=1 Tax=Calothrix sp. PCC 7507 TaxID=99598 RepID=UPI00029EC455|nr:hypothetical protein [Calothrix sp. PCC 7507]AFY36228.1 hypothetical protein Cal7507_5915 [Calothrix sp. PCC 7507]